MLSMPRNVQVGWEIFTLNPTIYLTVDFKKVVSELVYARSTLVESECVSGASVLGGGGGGGK